MQASFEVVCLLCCTLMLASILRTGQSYVDTQEEAEFMDKAFSFAKYFRSASRQRFNICISAVPVQVIQLKRWNNIDLN
jgi:hypothetical protein